MMSAPTPRGLTEIDPPQRLLMGPGPINAHPRVLRAMSAQLLGQFDPEFTDYMAETSALYRQVFQTQNRWTVLIDGSARAGIEAALVSVLEPGDRALVVSHGRFGGLLSEIAARCGAEVSILSVPWGEVADLEQIACAAELHRPRVIACVHGDTSTTIAQPLDGVGEIARRTGALSFVDATATLGGFDVPVDRWGADIVSAGLQKCLGGPPGAAPLTISDRAAERIFSRRHVEAGLSQEAERAGGTRIASNYFDLTMIMDYWSEKRLNHHTESTTLLYGARECARLVLEEGLEARIIRHRVGGEAVRAGILAMGLEVYGDPRFKMPHVTGVVIPEGVDGERVRTRMRTTFGIEIGSSFGPLHGKIWRIGSMGYNCTQPNILATLAALEAVLRNEGVHVRSGAAVDAAMAVFSGASS